MSAELRKRSACLLDQTNRIGIDFLLADLNTGLTFLQVAHVTSSPANRQRNFDRAYEVYRTVTRLKARVVLTPDAQSEIGKKLADLKNELEKAGYVCRQN